MSGPTIGRTLADSTAWHEPRPRPAGRPNVLVVLLDDVGFGQLGCFGSDIETPNIDRLAGDGLRFNRFHVTAVCSPTRASLLTGRNHHAVGMGMLTDLPTGFPGYNARMPRSAATLARVLKDEGWSTMAVGKWHLVPRDDRSAAGPFDHWPLGVGFERYYGFLHGDANHWTPTLFRDNSPVEAPRTPEEGYHLTEDLVDEALRMVTDQHNAAPDKPFFCYFAPGVGHAPHHVAPEWSERYAGKFDQGWEKWREEVFERQVAAGVVPEGTVLSERPDWIPDWETLTAEERQLFARFQEVFAGFLTHFDHHLGRLLDGLEALGVLDNTMVVLTSDNGASAEGGPIGSINEHRFGFGVPDSLEDNLAGMDEIGGFRSYNHYPWGWAWAGNSPFRLWKRYTWLGGTRTPLIVKPPRSEGDFDGAVRPQVCHVVDLFPTILETCGVTAPTSVDGVEQQRIDGAPMGAAIASPDAPDVRTTQYFELLGSRSIIHDGWKATTDHVSGGVMAEAALPGSRDLDADRWSLFRLADDFAEAHDLADEHPDVVAALEAEWWRQAEANQVLPVMDTLQDRIVAMAPPLWPQPPTLVVHPGGTALADESVPSLGLGAIVEADVTVPDSGDVEGVLAVIGDWSNGWALVVLDGCPALLLNTTSTPYEVRSSVRLTPGRHRVGFRFLPAEQAGVLLVDDEVVGTGPLPDGMGASGIQIGGGGLRLGYDAGFPVSDAYTPPFRWSGELHHVTFHAWPKPMSEESSGEVAARLAAMMKVE